MSNVTVRKHSNGDMLEVTLLTMFNMLADEDSYQVVLRSLMREGSATVELRDGPADVCWTNSLPRQSRQSRLPLNDYIADVRLTFEIPALVRCRAGSSSEARLLIADTVHGADVMPEGFSIELNQDDVERFMGNLEVGNVVGLTDVMVTSIGSQQLIGRSTFT